MIAIIVLAVLLFLLFIYTITLSAKISKYQADTDDKVENIEPKDGASGKPGPRGLTGPKGDTGDGGGIYMHAGRLTNLKHSDMVLDRLYGTGITSKAYLEKEQGKTSQYWTHYYNGMIVNKAISGRQCLTADENDQVFMQGCDGNDKQKWSWTSTGQLQFTGSDKCIGLEDEAMTTTNAMNPIQRNGKQEQPINGTKSKLILKNCKDDTNDLYWMWY